jgi:hypothetical protein
VVDDPDGNQFFFNYPKENSSGKTLKDEASRPAAPAWVLRGNPSPDFPL